MSLKETLKLIQVIADKYMVDKPYIVGGLPRDILLKMPNIKTTDVDLTTNSPEVLRLGILVANELNVTFELSEDGHVTVFADEFDIDFSSHFISDSVVKFLDGKHKGLEEAFSRDFTINALHQDLVTQEIVDPTGQGIKDIEDKLIRTPVPPDITLIDDPRRAYRAINLAARYGFDIAPEIKEFVVENPEIFSSEKIKDKYIAVKIGKAIQENPTLTLRLLKEMNLFKNVPLSGHFKEVLIKDKLLVEYLGSNALDSKTAFMASDWEEYISSGPAYKELADWWQDNYSKMPGNRNSSYHSWTSWYMDKYRNDWNFKHKSPEDTLAYMQEELSAPNIKSPAPSSFGDRIKKLFDFTGTKKREKGDQIDSEKDLPVNKNKTNTSKVNVRPGVNVDNVTESVKTFIEVLGSTAIDLGVETPIITSGWRSIEHQAKLMAKNWNSNGGHNGGREYMEDLYGKEYGGSMASIFERYGSSKQGLELAIGVINSRPVGSNHITNPGTAIDLSLTSGIKKVLDFIQSSGKFNMKIVDETKTAGPHYHVTIKGENSIVANIKSRKERLYKVGTTNND